MRVTSATWISAGLIAAAFAAALWAWYALPAGAGVPVNYLGLDGVRHHAVSRTALWLIPLISGFVTVVMTFAPGFGMHRDVERGAQVFDMTLISVAGLMLVVEVALIGRAMDPDFNVMRPVAIATGVLLLAVGNYLGKARQNGFIGLKTPWTLANAGVWDKTHRFTGRAMVLGGLVLIVLGVLFREAAVLGAAIAACSALPMLVGAAHSRSLYRALPRL
jgi:uncharacterized membrane protein